MLSRLKALRQEKGLTVRALGAEIGIHPSLISQFENRRLYCREAHQKTLSEFYGAPVAGIFENGFARPCEEVEQRL